MEEGGFRGDNCDWRKGDAKWVEEGYRGDKWGWRKKDAKVTTGY